MIRNTTTRRQTPRRTPVLVSVVALLVGLAGAGAATAGAVAGPGAVAADGRAGTSPAQQLHATVTPLAITTDGGGPVDSLEDYVEGSLSLDGVTRRIEIRGRGNSTWWWPKKPYKIKVAEDAALVGTTPQEEWVLLANYADRSALRTTVAFALADQTRLAWTPQRRYVDVTLNGQHVGLYLLTEQVEVNDGRVEIPDNAYLLEMNERYARDDEPGFRSRRGVSVAFKDPDELTRGQRFQVRGAVRRFEDVLYGQGFADRRTGYRRYVDVGSFIDWYLLEELFGNQDSDFRSSVYISWIPGDGGRFVMGPVWDLDLSAGSRWNGEVGPTGWHTRVGTHWIARMFQDPAFTLQVKQRWDQLRPLVDQVLAEVPAAAEALRPTAEVDWQLWHTVGSARPGSRHADSFSGEVDFMRNWLGQRAEWLSRPQALLGQVSTTVSEQARTIWVPVRLTQARADSVGVDYEWIPGTATRGIDFTMSEGRLVFAPGETQHFIPVTISADAEVEGAESIGIRLRSAGEGVVLSNPDRLTLTIAASDQPVDAMIRHSRDAAYVGDGIVNRTADGQTVETEGRRGSRRTFVTQVVNDGNARITIGLRARAAKKALRVRYVLGGKDVTGRLTGTDGLRIRLAPGQARQLKMKVTVRASAKPGSLPGALVRAVWLGDERRVDAVRAEVKVLE